MYDLTPNIVKALFTADLIGCEDQRIAGLLYNLIKNKNIIG
jgi:16S rRNA C1402 (ribose-2'-O) methylase RsmI